MAKNNKGGHYGALTQKAAQEFLDGVSEGLTIDQRPRGTKTYDVLRYEAGTVTTLGSGSTPREALAVAGFQVNAGSFDATREAAAHRAFCAEYGRPLVESKAAWHDRVRASVTVREPAGETDPCLP